MKITQVRAHVLRSALEQPFAFSQGWVSSRGATLVEVQTDEGVTGWGEALCQGLQPPEIAALQNIQSVMYVIPHFSHVFAIVQNVEKEKVAHVN
jgi:L-alanine-DL-glutamate epimerase-like enolase superfamily enzyme